MIWIALVVLLVGVVIATRFYVPEAQRRGELASVAEAGVPAKAQIVTASDTGRRYATHPVVRFGLEVRPAAGAPFEATVEQEVSVVDLPRLQPGAIIDVRFDPINRSKVAIVASPGAPR